MRKELGGYVPQRKVTAPSLPVPPLDTFKEVLAGSGGREVSTTGAFGRIVPVLLKNKEIGKFIVPIPEPKII